MVEITKIKSGSMYEEKESYSRAVVIDNWVYVSNTAGVNYKTRELSPDPVEQAKHAFANVERALAAAGCTLADVVMSTVYIPNVDHCPSVMAYVGERFKGIDPARTVLCPALGNPKLLVELEVKAYKGAGAAKVTRLDISQQS